MLAVFLLSCKKEMESGTGSLYGTVKAYGLEIPLSDCSVSLEPSGLSTKTFEDGEFGFDDLKSGYYTATISKRGYLDKSVIVKVNPGAITVIDIKLESATPYSLSVSELNFGDLQENMIISMYNNSDEECTYSISDVPSWMSLTTKTGTIRSLSTAQIEATVNRSAINYGKTTATLVFSFAGKVKMNLNVNASVEKVKLSAPTVTCSSSPAELKHTSLKITGTLNATGGQEVTEHGHCWSTSPNPTINNSRTRLGSRSSVGNFTSTITGLTANSKYYVRAYAVNAQGTSYSGQVTVQTPAVYTDKWNGAIASSFSMGSGTATDPYVITTGGELQLVKNYPSAYYVLGNNIDLNNYNWLPFEFYGNLNGKGYSILNLYISRISDNLGLFSELNGIVKNLTIKGINIQSPQSNQIGSIAGYMSGTASISNCSVVFEGNSKIKGNSDVGGIVGRLGYVNNSYAMYITDCKVTSSISEPVIIGNTNAGGIVGYMKRNGSLNKSLFVQNCHVNAPIYGGDYVGGICGRSDSGSNLEACSYNGTISGETYVGGISGGLDIITSYAYVNIINCKAIVTLNATNGYAGGIYGCGPAEIKVYGCYADGTVNCDTYSSKYVGGLAGYTEYTMYSAHMDSCYSTVKSDHPNFGGLCGGNDLRVENCASIFNDFSSYQSNCNTSCLNITQFLKETYSEYSQYWDFDNTWTWTGTVNGKTVNVSCPRLLWE